MEGTNPVFGGNRSPHRSRPLISVRCWISHNSSLGVPSLSQEGIHLLPGGPLPEPRKDPLPGCSLPEPRGDQFSGGLLPEPIGDPLPAPITKMRGPGVSSQERTPGPLISKSCDLSNPSVCEGSPPMRGPLSGGEPLWEGTPH